MKNSESVTCGSCNSTRMKAMREERIEEERNEKNATNRHNYFLRCGVLAFFFVPASVASEIDATGSAECKINVEL